MKILHLAESGAFGMERIIEHGKRVVAAGWFVKWGYYCINTRKRVTKKIPSYGYLGWPVCLR